MRTKGCKKSHIPMSENGKHDALSPDCAPDPLPASRFDPDCVYLVGTLQEGRGDTGAIIAMSVAGLKARYFVAEGGGLHSDGTCPKGVHLESLSCPKIG